MTTSTPTALFFGLTTDRTKEAEPVTLKGYSYSKLADDPVECFELGEGEECSCVECQRDRWSRGENNFKRGEAALVGGLDSPYGDGQAHYFCNRHLDQFFSDRPLDRFDPVLRMRSNQ
jgi:hypothetical protein